MVANEFTAKVVIGVIVVIGIGAVVAWRVSQNQAAEKTTKIMKKGSGIVYDWKPESFSGEDDDYRDDKKASQDSSKASEAKASLHGIDMDEVKLKMEKIRF